MSKPRFFIEGEIGESVDITGSDARHIRDVLRLKAGDVIEVVDSGGQLADIEITGVSGDRVSGRVIKRYGGREALPEVYLFQALPKAAKMDMIVRQSTEIGVAGIYPVITERVVVKVEAEKAGKKVERWQKIAAEAAKQSHRVSIPKVSPILSWQDALRELKKFEQVIVFWEVEREMLLHEVLKPEATRIALVIGPEGGLSQREASDLMGVDAQAVTLGETILRVETAGPVAVALALYDLRRKKKEEKPRNNT